MSIYYVGKGGSDGNNGTTWALRKLTCNGAEDIGLSPGDRVRVGPGVYREELITDYSGGNTYSTGTVSLTKGSATVTGSGTSWVANVGADYMFHVRLYEKQTDGVTNGTSTFTSSAANFQSNMVGRPIQINTKNSYMIAGVTDSSTITLSDPNSVGWPSSGSGLTFSIMSGEGHYEIASVGGDTSITLKEPWQGRTLTGLSYLTFNPITFEADVTGQWTDGIGGQVRITGSDDDQTATRTSAIAISSDDYRVFRGFTVDTSTSGLVSVDASDYCLLEDMQCLSATGGDTIYVAGATECITIRRCWIQGGSTGQDGIQFGGSVTEDCGYVVENCIFTGCGGGFGIITSNVGGVTVRNILSYSTAAGVRAFSMTTTGQVVHVTNSIMVTCNTGLQAAAYGQLIEDFNNIFECGTALNNVIQGSSSTTYPPLFLAPTLFKGIQFPWQFGALSQWSQLAAKTGVDERNRDYFGVPRPATASKCSWGPIQYHSVAYETTTTQGSSAASRVLADAGRRQYVVPVTAVSTTIAIYVYRESNYAGTLPQMIIKQPGVADRVTTDTGSASQWNQLSDTFTPDSGTDYVIVEIVSNNTATSGSYAVYFDTLVVN